VHLAAYGFLISERKRIPPQHLVAPCGSRHLRYPTVTDPGGPPLRPERHIPNSIATVRRRLIAALISRLPRCPQSKGTASDAANAILTAVGHNFRLVLAWLRILLRLIMAALSRAFAAHPNLKLALTDDYHLVQRKSAMSPPLGEQLFPQRWLPGKYLSAFK